MWGCNRNYPLRMRSNSLRQEFKMIGIRAQYLLTFQILKNNKFLGKRSVGAL